MTALEIVLVVFAALCLLVFVLGTGGYVALARRNESREDKLLEQLRQAERALAKAHAADKGWDPATVDAAARDAARRRFGASGFSSLQLVQVIDRPGTDADQAVFRVDTPDGEQSLTLGRREGVWEPA